MAKLSLLPHKTFIKEIRDVCFVKINRNSTKTRRVCIDIAGQINSDSSRRRIAKQGASMNFSR